MTYISMKLLEEKAKPSASENSEIHISAKLCEDIITIPDHPFEESGRVEFNILISKRVVQIVSFDLAKQSHKKLFYSRLGLDIRGKSTWLPWKARMVDAA